MKVKRSGTLLVMLFLVLIMVAALFGACGTKTTTQAPAPSTAPAPAQATSPAPATATKTLKIGRLSFFQYPLGIDAKKGIEAMAEAINAKGGLVVGGETYKLQPIIYDSKMDDATARAAVEKLIFDDKVNFILGDETLDAWISEAEQNKIVTIADGVTNNMFDQKFQYTFQGDVANTESAELWGWFAENYKNVKTFVAASPDNQIGHNLGAQVGVLAKAFGIKMIEQVFYPPESTDFSAIGTKVKNLNPDAFLAQYGGPISDSMCFKAAYQAGWKGQQFAASTLPAEVLTQVVPAEAVEGMVSLAWATELDPPTGAAKEFRDAYIAKFGKWDNPELVHTNTWYVLLGAIKAANSVDPEKVRAVLANGMKYDSPCFPTQGMMVSRPDLGNNRTVDTMGSMAVKQVVNGKAKILKVLTLDEAQKYNKIFFGW
jgi:branched-chain amino acid transport system substrate-binding protein